MYVIAYKRKYLLWLETNELYKKVAADKHQKTADSLLWEVTF
jgi:hypothetical protein